MIERTVQIPVSSIRDPSWELSLWNRILASLHRLSVSLKAAVCLETHTHTYNHQQHVDNLGIKLIWISVHKSELLHCKLSCYQSLAAWSTLLPAVVLSSASANQKPTMFVAFIFVGVNLGLVSLTTLCNPFWWTHLDIHSTTINTVSIFSGQADYFSTSLAIAASLGFVKQQRVVVAAVAQCVRVLGWWHQSSPSGSWFKSQLSHGGHPTNQQPQTLNPQWKQAPHPKIQHASRLSCSLQVCLTQHYVAIMSHSCEDGSHSNKKTHNCFLWRTSPFSVQIILVFL